MPLSLLSALVFSSALSTAALAAEPACPSGEELMFGCVLEDNQPLAICGTSDLSPTSGSVHLLLGKKGKTLTYPSGPAGQPFKYDRYTRPQTTYLSLEFEHDGAMYRVSDDESEGKMWRGLVIARGEKEEQLSCKADSVKGSLMKLEGKLPEPPSEP